MKQEDTKHETITSHQELGEIGEDLGINSPAHGEEIQAFKEEEVSQGNGGLDVFLNSVGCMKAYI